MALPFRQIHLDFHTGPDIEDVGADFDANEWVTILKNAHVNHINLFARCIHGFFSYKTKFGDRHPGLVDDSLNILDEQVAACKKNDITVGIYLEIGINQNTAYSHQEWLQVDTNGVLGATNLLDEKYGVAKMYKFCLNNEDYKKEIKNEIEEIMDRFNPYSLWLDSVKQHECVCYKCRNEMLKLGLDLKKIDDVKKHSRMVEIAYVKEIFNYIMQNWPDVKVYFNGSGAEPDLCNEPEISNARRRENMSFVDVESIPGEFWRYSHYPICANFLNHRGYDLAMMNGRFHTHWADFGTLRNLEALEFECFRALSTGAVVCVGDQLHPRGCLNKAVYKRIGRVYEQIEKIEGYFENSKKICNIGIYVDNNALEKFGKPTIGAYKIFTSLHQSFDLIDCECELDKYELIVVPDSVELNSIACNKLQDYIHSNGKVIITGNSCVTNDHFDIDFGVEYIAKAPYVPRYMSLDFNLFKNIPEMNYVFYNQGTQVRSDKGEILARVANPYFNRGWLKFSSLKHTAMKETTDEPAIIRNGNVVYISQPIFSEFEEYGNRLCRDIIENVLNLIRVEATVTTDLPGFVEVYLRKKKNTLILPVLNYITRRECEKMDTIQETIPLYGKELRIKKEGKPKSVKEALTNSNVSYEYLDGNLIIKPDTLNGFQVFVIE